MNYDVSKDVLYSRDLAFEGCKEVPIDLDFSLPDYCQDIQKVLKCFVKSNVNSRNISGDQANIDGTAEIKILYVGQNSGDIQCCENSVPFSCSLDIKSTPENAIMRTFIKTEYMNCRAVSQRKIDIHGALSLCVQVYGKKTTGISTCINGKDIEQKIEKIMTSDFIAIGQQQFSINETLEVTNCSPKLIINHNTVFLNDDYKIMPGKIVVKGKIYSAVVYVDNSEPSKIKSENYEIPISQIVDVPGINEDCECVINTEILSDSIELQSENSSEESKPRINMEIKASADVSAFKNRELGIVSDAYSRDYNVESNSEILKSNKIIKKICKEFSHKCSVSLPNMNIKSILDVSSISSTIQSGMKNSNAEFSVKVNLGIIGIDSDDTPFYLERSIDLKLCPEDTFECSDIIFDTKLLSTAVSIISFSENDLNLKINMNVCSTAFMEQKSKMINDISTDETIPSQKDLDASLTLYYAKEGESIWDIARKYFTSVSSIKDENNISEDSIMESRMVMIPSK